MSTKKSGKGRRILTSAILLLIIALLITGGVYAYKIHKSQLQAKEHYGIPGKTNSITPEQNLNILVLGLDSGQIMNEYRAGRGRSDTMMLFAYRPKEKKIYQVSIPRDSRVPITGHGVTKINAAFSYGGAQLAQQTVENLLDIKIDRVVVLNYNSFIKLVDAIGGVTMDVEPDINKRFNITDPIPTGHVKLTGEQAFRYVHARESDTERVHRQQKFISALFTQIKENNAFLTVFKYYLNNPDDLSTNISTGDALKFRQLANNYGNYNLVPLFVDGEGKYINGVSYWIIDEAKLGQIKKLLKDY